MKTSTMSIQLQLMLTDYAGNKSHLSLSATARWTKGLTNDSQGFYEETSVITSWLFSQDLGYSLFTLAYWFSLGFFWHIGFLLSSLFRNLVNSWLFFIGSPWHL